MATQTQQPARPTSTAAKPTPPAGGEKASNYLVEVQKEMRKVSWPKRNELINNTILTLVSSLVLSLLIFGADQLISQLLSLVY